MGCQQDKSPCLTLHWRKLDQQFSGAWTAGIDNETSTSLVAALGGCTTVVAVVQAIDTAPPHLSPRLYSAELAAHPPIAMHHSNIAPEGQTPKTWTLGGERLPRTGNGRIVFSFPAGLCQGKRRQVDKDFHCREPQMNADCGVADLLFLSTCLGRSLCTPLRQKKQNHRPRTPRLETVRWSHQPILQWFQLNAPVAAGWSYVPAVDKSNCNDTTVFELRHRAMPRSPSSSQQRSQCKA